MLSHTIGCPKAFSTSRAVNPVAPLSSNEVLTKPLANRRFFSSGVSLQPRALRYRNTVGLRHASDRPQFLCLLQIYNFHLFFGFFFRRSVRNRVRFHRVNHLYQFNHRRSLAQYLYFRVIISVVPRTWSKKRETTWSRPSASDV